MNSVAVLPATDLIDTHVAEEVRAWMGRRRISQQRVADALGTTQAAVSRRLTGAVSFSASELASIADLVGAHPGDFFPGGGAASSAALNLSADEERLVYALRASRTPVGGGTNFLGVTPIRSSWKRGMVGPEGLEPPTSSVKSREFSGELLEGPWEKRA